VREWDAGAYHQISNPQFAMAVPVLARLPLRGDEIVLDVGCGTGRVTELLIERLPHGKVIAVDVSSNMLNTAREYLSPAYGQRVTYVQADAAALPLAEVTDAIFSTASFHWVLDHQALFHSLFAALEPGGRLVAQCGGGPNLQRIHLRSDALMHGAEFAPYFPNWREPWEFADADTTARRLEAAGFMDINAWIEPSPIVQPDAETFATFLTNVILRHHLSRLPTRELQQAFVAHITALAAADTPAFELDYWRLNIDARRPLLAA